MKFIVGDVHGCYTTLMALLEKIPKHTNPEDIIFVGDLIDRGPKNREVINYVRENNHPCLMGNHEDLMVQAVNDNLKWGSPYCGSNWSPNGGNITYAEYQDDEEALLSDKEWMETLPLHLHFPDEKDGLGRELVVSHAPCLDFYEQYIELTEEEDEFKRLIEKEGRIHSKRMEEISLNRLKETIMWNRAIPKKNSTEFFNVFGHNIISLFIKNSAGQLRVPIDVITPEKTLFDSLKGYAAIDTGCFASKTKTNTNLGTLTCLEFPTMRIIQQENIEGGLN